MIKKFISQHGFSLLVWAWFLSTLIRYLRDGHVVVSAGNAGLFHQDADSSKLILVGLFGITVVTTVWDVILTMKNKKASNQSSEPT